MSNRRKATGRTVLDNPLPGVVRHWPLPYQTPLTFGDRGCNLGGSGLRPLRFHDGRLRNRVERPTYRRDGSRKG